jgi:signal transduction histidine kinase
VEKRETALRTGRAIIYAGVVLLIVLAVFVFLLFRSYRKSSQLATKLNASNSLLVAESNNLKSAQDELIVARDNATTTEKQKSEFIDNFIHEVTTPLNAISEYSQLVIDSLDDTKRKYMKKYCDIVTLNVDLLQTLVNDVLDITAADQSLLTVFRRPYSLATICTVACESIKKRVHPDVQLIFENADEPDWIVLTDATRVEQVLINLLSNAAKFTETGEIRLRYDVDVNRKRLTFSVTDTGIGVPRGREDEIFKRYVKLSKYSQGLGLGLPVCRLLADLLSGSVTIDKRYRQGARFVFTLNNCSIHRVNRDIEKH